MAKSIKLQDDTFLDTSSIVHDTTPLKDIVDGFTVDISRTDLNDYTDKFIAGYGHNLTNTPTTDLNLGHLISIPRHDETGFVTQYFSPYTTTDVYIRKCEDGTWGNWVSITPVEKKRHWLYSLTTATPSQKAWSLISSNKTTDTIPAGKYMIIYKASFYANANGICTINASLDGERLGIGSRASMPLVTGLTSSAQITYYKEFSTDATHVVNNYVYTNASIGVQNSEVEFIRID